MQGRADTKGRLLTVKKASKVYGVDPSLVYHWLRYRRLDFFKLGKKVLFWEEDFLSFLEEHKVKRCNEFET